MKAQSLSAKFAQPNYQPHCTLCLWYNKWRRGLTVRGQDMANAKLETFLASSPNAWNDWNFTLLRTTLECQQPETDLLRRRRRYNNGTFAATAALKRGSESVPEPIMAIRIMRKTCTTWFTVTTTKKKCERINHCILLRGRQPCVVDKIIIAGTQVALLGRLLANTEPG